MASRCSRGQRPRYRGHENSQYKLDCCLSNDDAFVISGSEDRRICMWDLVEVRAAPRHGRRSVAKGAQLATPEPRGPALVAPQGKVVKELTHAGVVSTIAYHPSEPLLLSGSTDGTVKVWGPDDEA